MRWPPRSSHRITERRWVRPALTILLVAYVCIALRYALRTSFIVDGVRVSSLWDDAMISMRYADHFAQGKGLVWNVGERVQGYSNLGLTLFMGLLHLLPLPLEQLPLVFQIVSAFVLAGIVHQTAQLASRMSSSPLSGLMAAVATVFFAPLGIWGIQGADSAAIALALMLASVRAYDVLERRRSRSALSVFLPLAAGILVRLDFTLTYFLFFAFLLVHSKERRSTLVRGLLPLAITLGGILLFGLLYYGDPLPNTYYLKATGIPLRLLLSSGWSHLVDPTHGAFRGRFWIVVALFVVFMPPLARRSRTGALLGTTVLLHVAYFVWIGGDWVYLHLSRFLVPMMPLVIVIVTVSAGMVMRSVLVRLRAGTRRRPVALALVLSTTLLAYASSQAESHREWWSSGTPFLRDENERSYRLARYIAFYSNDSLLLGVFWAGVLPYYCDRPSLDLLGRTDRHIAHGPMVPADYYWPGHAKRDWDYVLREKNVELLLGEMPEMREHPEYVEHFCHPDAPHWLALRRESFMKWRHRSTIARCAPGGS